MHSSTSIHTNNIMPLLDEDSPSGEMIESFYSERSAGSNSSVASASGSRVNVRQDLSKSTPALVDGRGRSLKRTGTGSVMMAVSQLPDEDQLDGLPNEGGHGIAVEGAKPERSSSRSLSMARGSSGRGKRRRAAGVAFMSIGLLAFGRSRGAISTGGSMIAGRRGDIGRVLTPLSAVEHHYIPHSPTRHPAAPNSLYDPFTTTFTNLDYPGHPDTPPSRPPVDYQRLIGRINAWACTTLYLTSRLPQIWKNVSSLSMVGGVNSGCLLMMQFKRRSVEGLSILLFVFAFLGNSLYVTSIALNGPTDGEEGQSARYFLEALPSVQISKRIPKSLRRTDTDVQLPPRLGRNTIV